MIDYTLKLTLLSEAVFGRGDGVAGLVDTEVEHDERGLPFLHGRGVKGLFTAQCAEILGALRLQQSQSLISFEKAATQLFGAPGSNFEDALLLFGPAQLPKELRDALAVIPDVELRREEVLTALTTIRRQTMIDENRGAAKDNTLRATRVLIRGLTFEASLSMPREPISMEKALIAACVKAIRGAGTYRARGLGYIKTDLMGSTGTSLTDEWMRLFEEAL
jgi:hypothetical protein